MIPHSSVDPQKAHQILSFSSDEIREGREMSSLYDYTEYLLTEEEQSSKKTLTHLWELKNNLNDEQCHKTVDMLIEHYQKKIDLLRNKERRLRNISDDSKELLLEKENSQKELVDVKKHITMAKNDIEDLEKKITSLKHREAELTLISTQIEKELSANAAEVINGLYEVIISDASNNIPFMEPSDRDRIDDIDLSYRPKKQRSFNLTKIQTKDGLVLSQYYTTVGDRSKSVFNSRFFAEKIQTLLPSLHTERSKRELLLCIKDTQKRVKENISTEFEISCNELINHKKLSELIRAIVEDDINAIREYCERLTAKIIALGKNYNTLLEEQMR